MGVFFGLFAVDYLLTVLVAVVDRRYMLLIYGLGFTFVRIVDAITLLSTIRDGLRPLQHTGRWQPPTRYQRVE